MESGKKIKLIGIVKSNCRKRNDSHYRIPLKNHRIQIKAPKYWKHIFPFRLDQKQILPLIIKLPLPTKTATLTEIATPTETATPAQTMNPNQTATPILKPQIT